VSAVYYECGECGFYHQTGYAGSCDDEDGRFDLESLNDKHPDGWEEIELVETDQPTNPNYLKLTRLQPHIDLNGNRLEIGCMVRVYISAKYRADIDEISGTVLTEKTGAAVDGVLEKIGEMRDGVPCYSIRAVREDLLSHDTRWFNQSGELVVIARIRRMCHAGDYIYPVVNGHPGQFCTKPSEIIKDGRVVDISETCPAFSVFRLG
jgi:hypothetical protein